MEFKRLLHGLVVFVLGVISVDGRMINVTFTNNKGEYTVASPPHSAPFTTLIWELTSPPGTKVALNCKEILFLKRINCSEGSLTIWDGITQFNICNVLSGFQRKSVRNKMFIQYRAGFFGVGSFQCKATVNDNSYVDVMGEPDSSEHGQGVGQVATSCPCGWTNKKRIVGGKETLVNEYVFPVSIKHNTDRQGFCGGSIITPMHILTAAHCLHNVFRPLQVVVGEHNFNTAVETNATEIIPVAKKIIHENYNHDEMTNDIALLVLSRPIKYSQLVGPVCLPTERYDLLGKYIKVLGWGMTSTNGKFSNVLQKVNLQVVDLKRCASRYSNHIDLNNKKQICTFAHKKDSCQGDSGGPLVYHDPQINRYVQVALVSYGKECASEDPAVNIEVAAYYDWIQEKVSQVKPAVSTCEKI